MNRDFLNIIYTRRSVRKFTGEKVRRMTSCNSQGRYVRAFGLKCSAMGLCRVTQGHTLDEL